MKILYSVSVLLSVLTFACTSKEQSSLERSVSEQSFQFEIYDSLVVDYIGNLYLTDVSPDGKHFLLIDHQTDTLFITDPEGEIRHKFTKKGDGPGLYQDSRLGPPRFLSSEEIIIPAFRGFYIYSLSGEATRTFFPDFNPRFSVINPFDNQLIRFGKKIYYPWEGRLADQLGVDGREFQTKVRKVEVLDLNSGQFTPVLPFPKDSKFSSGEKSYMSFSYSASLSKQNDSLYVAFSNEPVIYGYHFSNLDSPASVHKIPFKEFMLSEPKNSEKFGQYEMKEIYKGSIRSFHRTEKNRFLIDYNRGLTNEEYDEIFDLIEKDQEAGFQKMKKTNISGPVLFDGKSISEKIHKPIELGYSYLFINEDEIWFAPDYEEIEKDYSVIYKTRLIEK